MKINFVALDHLQLCIPKNAEDQARAFYLETLGMIEIPKPEALQGRGGFWMRAGEIEIHIGSEEVLEYTSKRHPAFLIQECEKVKEYLKGRGVRIKEEIEIPGVQRFSIFDPFGNRIELLEK